MVKIKTEPNRNVTRFLFSGKQRIELSKRELDHINNIKTNESGFNFFFRVQPTFR